ncbi:YheC/YheD family endospore coat-associated protein [Heliorestis convoluta]|uniref:YheC/YheD family protein n=1 Tax=Heliorestis convoluta TaxID=356322 RepID=A0A5Q2MZI4_9FIRM|nr:YheC/YheD family protein [Heliorestis convoluta]QGG46879.1 YheC/YheD family protein [Heliorestis convoluta]
MKIFILGILVHAISKPEGFQGNGLFFRQLAEEGAKLGLSIFVFSPNQVHWKERMVTGFHYNLSKKKWKRKKIPLPDIVYDRYFNLGKGWREAVYCRRNLNKVGVALFNPVVADKYVVHGLLQNDPDIASHLPETYLFAGQDKELKRLLLRWGSAYLKPVLGTKGEGIVRITNNSKQGSFYIEEAKKGARYWASLHKTMAILKRSSKLKKYVIQQAIDSGRWKDRIFDIRVLAQRDSTGKWNITGMAARVAANGITCNIHTGAKAISMEELKEEKSITVSEEEMEKVALKITDHLTMKYPTLGELGLDFLIDQDNKIWFLEANARPGRIIFQKIGDQEKRLNAVRRPLEYAMYLASQRKAR